MMITFVTMPGTMVADIGTVTTDLFTDAGLLIALAIGLPVGFWIIRSVVSLVKGRG